MGDFGRGLSAHFFVEVGNCKLYVYFNNVIGSCIWHLHTMATDGYSIKH